MAKGIIIGLGNPSRGDDGVGPEVVRQLLAAPRIDGWDVVRTSCEPTRLMDAWRSYERVVLIDAVTTGRDAIGTIFRWNLSKRPLPVKATGASSHSLSLNDVVELARTLDCLPASVEVIGIECGEFTYSSSLSSPVAAAVTKVVQTIRGKEF